MMDGSINRSSRRFLADVPRSCSRLNDGEIPFDSNRETWKLFGLRFRMYYRARNVTSINPASTAFTCFHVTRNTCRGRRFIIERRARNRAEIVKRSIDFLFHIATSSKGTLLWSENPFVSIRVVTEASTAVRLS